MHVYVVDEFGDDRGVASFDGGARHQRPREHQRDDLNVMTSDDHMLILADTGASKSVAGIAWLEAADRILRRFGLHPKRVPAKAQDSAEPDGRARRVGWYLGT